MIVRDEQANLPRCLRSVRGAVDEIVVVDTGSVDGTPDIARQYGARVVDFAWTHHFAKARNASLEAARGDWALVLDADEELPTETATALRELVRTAEVDGYQLTLRNLQPAADLLRWRDASLTRLFRLDPEFRYTGRIHEQIAPSILMAGGDIDRSDLVVLHYGYVLREAQGSAREERNLKLLLDMAAVHPDDAYVQFQLGATLMVAGRERAARLALHRALALDDGDLGRSGAVECHLRLAQLALATSDDAAALAHAETCLALGSPDTLAWYIKALACVGLERWATAEQALDRVQDRADLAPSRRRDVQGLLAACRQRRLACQAR